jgi:hypothetical protein
MEAVLADIYNKNFRESTALDDSPHGLVNIASASKLMTHPRPIENFKGSSLFFLEYFSFSIFILPFQSRKWNVIAMKFYILEIHSSKKLKCLFSSRWKIRHA